MKKSEISAYGLAAVGKDMVYMLSASYILYYYQDLLGVNAVAMGIILLIARVFDAFNDPIMGVIVAKTKTRWGKFRPWLFIGTTTNAVILYFMFAAPPELNGEGLVAYVAVTYILWGVTYTMMDIPFWSMIPAFTKSGSERENLSAIARSCAGVGSAVVTMITVMAVSFLGRGNEKEGFRIFALIIAVAFVIFVSLACMIIKEKATVDMESPSIGEMFKALFNNDQSMVVVIAIVLINCALYITSNLLIYFFKYDIGGENWNVIFTAFNAFGGGIQILSMMIAFPLLRSIMSTIKIFKLSMFMAIFGYSSLCILMFAELPTVYILFVPAFFIFLSFGLLTVLTTVFLANTVDYGEYKNGRRDESVIFSMQTFVVKLSSGVAALVASLCLSYFNISSDTSDVAVEVADGVANFEGLRMTMTVVPIIGLLMALIIFNCKYILTEKKLTELSEIIEKRKEGAEVNIQTEDITEEFLNNMTKESENESDKLVNEM